MRDLIHCLSADEALRPPLLMGILNLTPDSFHDGGAYFSRELALTQLECLQAQGADIVDLGGMSSRPGHQVISAEAEIQRLALLLEALPEQRPLLSVDTDKPEVAAYALAHGVNILNDCSGLLQPEMFRLAAEQDVPMILMHRQGREGEHRDILQEVKDFFQESIRFARRWSVDEKRLILDPGLGFNKDLNENLQLMWGLSELRVFGRPILLGFSHKRFIAAISGEAPGLAPGGNLAAAIYGMQQGASILRMHDLNGLQAMLRAADVLWNTEGRGGKQKNG